MGILFLPVENQCIQWLFECINCLAGSGAAVKRTSWGNFGELEPVVMILPTLALVLCCVMLNTETETQREVPVC